MRKLILLLLLAFPVTVSGQIDAAISVLKSAKALKNKGTTIAQLNELYKLIEELACAETTYKDYSADISFSACFLKSDITLLDFRIAAHYIQLAALIDALVSATEPESPSAQYLAISKANDDARLVLKDLTSYIKKYEKIQIGNILTEIENRKNNEYLTYNKYVTIKK